MTEIINSIRQLILHLSTTDLVLVAGVLATAVQFLVNKFRDLGRLENWLLSLPLPFFMAFVVFLPKDINWTIPGSFAYIVAQLAYLFVSEVKRRAAASAVSALAAPAPATAQGPAEGSNF